LARQLAIERPTRYRVVVLSSSHPVIGMVFKVADFKLEFASGFAIAPLAL
jgi:hypothetical protein